MVSESKMYKQVQNDISVLESNNLLEDLHIPDSRLIDGDASELALIGKPWRNTPSMHISHIASSQILVHSKSYTKRPNVY